MNLYTVKTFFKLSAKVLAALALLACILSLTFVITYKWMPVPTTPLMLLQDGSYRHQWRSIDKISKHLQLAVVCSEDQKFLTHFGFDVAAIEKALEQNRQGGKLRGASSISQQTAKNVFLWPSRTWIRKGLEVYFTFLIELLWSKERILEVYLNSIEMGDGIYGAEAAAQYWFGKSASRLNTQEAAAIAAILPSPRRYIATPPTEYIQSRIDWITRQMSQFGELRL